MTGEVLIDTSVLIDHLRSKDKSNTFLIRVLESSTYAYISVLTLAELYSGKSVWEKEEVRKEVEQLVSQLNRLGISESISRFSGYLNAKFNLPLVDALIAATCYEHKLTLATLDHDLLNKELGIPLLKIIE